MISTIKTPIIPWNEKTNSRGKISNQMKNKVKVLENLYKKHLLVTKNNRKNEKIKVTNNIFNIKKICHAKKNLKMKGKNAKNYKIL